jgi:cystathionine gamma-synthase
MKGTPVVPPVYLTATYQFDQSDDLIDVVQNHSGYIYSRWDNPSVVEVEKVLAGLEGYDHAIGFSSGMSAITTTLMALITSDSRVVSTREIYGGTFEFLHDVLPKLNVNTEFVNCWDTERLIQEIRKGVDILYLESPTNPLLRIVDIQPLVEEAHKQGTVVLLDSTFASPINQRPLEIGVDIVIHSATKYLGGHHDITAGLCCCNEPHYGKVWHFRKILGGVMDPMSAFLTLRGMRTLELRIKRQNETAIKIARYLLDHAKVNNVNYPGLPSHPDHSIAQRQMSGFGGMLSFELKADFDQTKLFMDRLKVIKLATSLGGVTSLATQPITNTHVGLSPEDRSKAGVSESLVRLSVGIEDEVVLMEDLEQALGYI